MYCSTRSISMTNNRGIPMSLIPSKYGPYEINETNKAGLVKKNFYSIVMQQHRYVTICQDIIVHFSFENAEGSSIITDVLFEAFTAANTDGLAQIFMTLETFISMKDSLNTKRCTDLFIGTRALMNHLETLKNESHRNRLVCICIRSLMTLIQKVPILTETLGHTRVSMWAPWMLKFCFQFQKSCTDDTTAFVYIINDNIHVYGENDNDRDISWKQRAENTLQILQDVVTSLGGDCNNLIPDDTFSDTIDTTNIIGNNNFVSITNDNVINGNIINNTGMSGAMNYIKPEPQHSSITSSNTVTDLTSFKNDPTVLSDGMTDEELEIYLSSNAFL